MGIDWNNKAAVIAYAEKLGHGQTVIHHAGRTNYNITHTARRDLWDKEGVMVIHRT